MKDSFVSVKDCLHYWEFCPLCGKRNNIELMSLDYEPASAHNTILTNSVLQAVNMAGSPLISISLSDNKFLFNMLNAYYVTCVRLYCKGFHFSVSYKLSSHDEGIVTTANKLVFFVKDSKTNLLYNVVSDYRFNQTSIQLSENSNTIQDFKTSLIGFSNLNKKALIKRIRALSLLN